MAKWRYPGYLPKPPHEMTDFDWQSYKTGLSKEQMSERYSGITSDLIPAFEQIQAQGLGDINPDPYKRVSSFGAATELSGIAGLSNPENPRSSQSNFAYGAKRQSSLGGQSLSRLPSRSEMNDHYLDGEGQSITVPIAYLPIDELDWPKVARDLIRSTISGGDDYVNGVVHVSFYGTNAYGVLGQMNFDLAGTVETYEDGSYEFEGGVDASSGGEMYDFDMHSWTKEPLRNLATIAGKPRWDRDKSTEPQPFFIEIPGSYGIQFSGVL